MRQKTHRMIAILCVLCMLFTSMPASVYSDSKMVATPTDLGPVTTEETGTEESATEETRTEAPAANRTLTAGDDTTIQGELEGENPKDYLIRFTPEKDQTMYLILTAGQELTATVTDETTGAKKAFEGDGTDEDGNHIRTAADYRTEEGHSYLICISGARASEFTVRLVRKSIYHQEQAGEEPAAEDEEETTEASEQAEANPDVTDEEPGDVTTGEGFEESGEETTDETLESAGEDATEGAAEENTTETTEKAGATESAETTAEGETPAQAGNDRGDETNENEPELTEDKPELPEADREVTAGDDVTVTGTTKANGDYLIRFSTEADQTVHLILTTDGEADASATDETTGSTKRFNADETNENGERRFTLPFYKAKQGGSYLIRISSREAAAFSLRLVRNSVLKAEEEQKANGEAPAETAAEAQGEVLSGEDGKEPVEEPTEDPAAEEESDPAEEPAAEAGETPEEELTEEEPAEDPTAETKEEPEESAEEPKEENAGETEEEAGVDPEAEGSEEEPAEETGEETAKESAEETGNETGDEPEEELTEEEQAEETGTPATQTDLEAEEDETPATQTDLEAAVPTVVRIYAAYADIHAYISFMTDAGIPEDAELQIRELTPAQQEAYQALTAQALNAENESYLRYTRYIEFSLIHEGEAIPLTAPVKVYIVLPDLNEGINALQVVRFDNMEPVLTESELTDDPAIIFETDTFGVFGIGNALVPVSNHENELAKVEVLSFSEDTPVTLAEAEAPEVEEGLEVLGTFTIEGSTAADAEGENQDGLFIKAELKEDAELNPMEGVALYSVDENGQTDILMEELTEDAKITELEATQVAVVKDTGYRHLTLTVNPDESTDDQIVTLDGMMPKCAEAAVEDVTIAHAEASGMELSEEHYITEEEIREEATEEETAKTAEDSEAKEQAKAEAGREEPDKTQNAVTEEAPEAKEETAETTADSAKDEETFEATEEAGKNNESEETAEITADSTEETETEAKAKLIAAYDITILNGEEEYQPEEDKPITVEILDSRITTDKNIELWHIQEDGTEEQVTEFALEEGRIVFEATGFSVYKVVEAPAPVVINIADKVQNTAELARYFNDPESGANGFYLSYGTTNYATNQINNTTKGALIETTSKADASIWFLESTGEDDTYLICSYPNGPEGEKKYIHQVQSENPNEVKIEMADTGTPIKFSDTTTTAKFYLKHSTKELYLQHSGTGTGIRFYKDHANATNSQMTLTYVTPPRNDDPYKLDGMTYGLIRYKEGIRGQAMMADADGNNLRGQEVVVKENPLDRQEPLYVAKGTDITMWTFNSKGTDLYTLSTEVDGALKYLKIVNGGVSLVETEGAASVVQVIPGSGSYAGKLRLKADKHSVQLSKRTANKIDYFYFTGKADSATTGDQWLNLVTESNLEDDDFVPYSAKKVSIAEEAKEVKNGDQVVIYTRVWNSTEGQEGYEFYVVDHNGDLVRAYEEGDSIQWIGTKINTVLWDFTEYYWEDTNTPNYYYDLKNDYTGHYLAPQVSGSTFSNNTIGLNLNGRRYNDYYTTILAWDDPIYAYAGLKTENGTIVPCRIGKAEDFYFAKMDPASSTEQLTEVPTVDHTQYGITMKMYNYSGSALDNSINTMHTVMGYSKFDDKGRTKGLLSRELDANGYPTATKTNKSLQQLFTGSPDNDVNHLFLSSTYKGSGYFAFDSAQNYARLSGGDFTVYKEIGTHDGKTTESMKHGQFFPYNTIEPDRFASNNPENLYTSTLEELSEDNPRKYEKLHLIDNPDFYFGMEISASFVQTPNGKDAWKHDIIYEFTGDDDFWLYVDGELVIDLGGIHSALYGKVNFATGVVVFSDKNNTKITTSLYEIFKENYRERYKKENGAYPADDEEGLVAYLGEKFTEKNGKMVFKDYSTHTMRIFYMERGGGASNLKMRFNLASVNPNQVQLTKEVSGIADADFLTTRFPFQIWYQPDSSEDGYETLVQAPDNEHGFVVTHKNTKDRVDFSQSVTIAGTEYDNVFFLKAGQTVEINMPEGIGKYYIVECGLAGNIFNQRKDPDTGNISYWAEVNDDEIPGVISGNDSGNATYDYTTTATLVTERASVVFDNHVNPDYLRTLSITKKLLAEDGETELTAEEDNTAFRYRLSLGEDLAIYNMGDYYIKDPQNQYCEYIWVQSTGHGQFVSIGKGIFDTLTDEEKERVTFTSSPGGAIDKIPAGYTIEIRDLPAGTRFMVEERPTDMPAGYTWKEYIRDESEGTYDVDTTGINNIGRIKAGQNAHIIVANQRGWGLTVKKEWTDKFFTSYHDPIYVAVYADEDATEPIPGTIRRIAHPEKSTYYFFESLVTGKTFDQYTVHEVTLSGTNPTVDADGVVKDATAGNVSIVQSEEPVEIRAKDRSGNEVYPVPQYLVSGKRGAATGVTGNVRTDEITNQRGGGIIIRLHEWDGETPLAGAVFTLTDEDGNPVGDETYTSNSRGLITVMYDFKSNYEYTLTEVSTPTGYQGLEEPLKFKVFKDEDEEDQIEAWTDNGDWRAWHNEHTLEQTSDENLIAYINVKNRRFTLKAVKYDPAEETFTPLSGAEFALYKQFIGSNGQPVKDYAPITGYDSLISGDDGIIALIDQNLSPRTYYLTETKSPIGYDRNREDVLFTITPLGYVINGDEGDLITETDANGTVAYTLRIPNMKLSLVPPVLYVTKTVEGNGAEETRAFTFVVEGLTPGKEYVYQEFDYVEPATAGAEPGWIPGSEQSALGLLIADQNGKITFYLQHHERIGISLPYASHYTVTETSYDRYTPSHEERSTDIEIEETQVSSTVESLSDTKVGVTNFVSDVYIDYTNTCADEILPAPTGLSNRKTPYLLMMAVALIMMAVLGYAGLIRSRKRTTETEPAENRAQSRTERAEYNMPQGRGAPPSAPPCPRAALWTQKIGSTGKRVIRKHEQSEKPG